jgi:hypothetical protein
MVAHDHALVDTQVTEVKSSLPDDFTIPYYYAVKVKL